MADSSADGRLNYLDHLRAALVILVVLHHIALVYGALAPFYYQEPPFTDPLAFTVLGVFALANQGWFMGALFLLAGYFTPSSFDRRGGGSFVTARLIRLGIPIFIGILLIEPLARLGFYLMPAELTGISSPLSWAAYPYLIGLGPLWFIAMLLIFSLGYALWRTVRDGGDPPKEERAFPGLPAIAGFVLVLAGASYLFRMLVPLGQDTALFFWFLSFPTIAYLPQYLGLFVVGIAASRLGWLDRLPDRAGLWGFLAALVASVVLFPLALTGQLLTVHFGDATHFPGNGEWQSAVYALWDSTMAVGMPLVLIVLFRKLFSGASAFGRFLSQQSYAVYILHSVVLVHTAYALRGIELPALLKFWVLAAVTLPASFGAAWLLRRIPIVRRVV